MFRLCSQLVLQSCQEFRSNKTMRLFPKYVQRLKLVSYCRSDYAGVRLCTSSKNFCLQTVMHYEMWNLCLFL